MLFTSMQVGTDPAEFKNHQLPLARIKKVPGLICCLCSSVSLLLPSTPNPVHALHLTVRQIESSMQFHSACCAQIMKSDEDVRMISAEAPVLFARVRIPALHDERTAKIPAQRAAREHVC